MLEPFKLSPTSDAGIGTACASDPWESSWVRLVAPHTAHRCMKAPIRIEPSSVNTTRHRVQTAEPLFNPHLVVCNGIPFCTWVTRWARLNALRDLVHLIVGKFVSAPQSELSRNLDVAPNRCAIGARLSCNLSVAVTKGGEQMAETPLWLIHGSADTTNRPESIESIYQSILNAGGTQVKFTEYQGLEHVPTILRARNEPGLLEWLLAQRHDGIMRTVDVPDAGGGEPDGGTTAVATVTRLQLDKDLAALPTD
jgi:hypothetical protein